MDFRDDGTTHNEDALPLRENDGKLFLDKCPLPPLVGTSPHLVKSKPQHILMGQIRYKNARHRSVARENRHRASGFGGKGPQLPMPEILACHPRKQTCSAM